MASSPSCDWRGKKMMEVIDSFDENATFFGVGGPQMQSHKNFKNYGNTTFLSDKPFYPRYVHSYHPLFHFFLPLLETKFRVFFFLRNLENSSFWDEIANNPCFFISLEGEIFAYRFFEKVKKYYNKIEKSCPPTLLVTKTKKLLDRYYFKNIDFLCTYLPQAFDSVYDFSYPNQFIGKQIIFETYKKLLLSDSKYAYMVEGNNLAVKPTEITLIVEEICFHKRKNFRESNAISQSACVIYVSVGNSSWEIQRNTDVVISSIDKFITDLQASNRISREQTVILWRSKPDLDFDQRIGVRCLNVEESHLLDAIASADIGAVCNGDAVFEAAVAQLPTVILDPQGKYYSYMSLLYNIWSSDLNFAADGELLPETTARNFAGAIAEFWKNWYLNPKEHYRLAQKITPKLLSLLPQGNALAPNEEFELKNSTVNYIDPDVCLKNYLQKITQRWNIYEKKKSHSFFEASERLKFVYDKEII